MLAPPKPLLRVGIDFLTTRTSRQLSRPGRTQHEQEAIFGELVSALGHTWFGENAGITPKLPYSEFRQQVALRTYEDFLPEIERMKHGEADVLWPGQVSFYAVSSGTTVGRTKFLPVTDALLAHFRQAGLRSLLYYTSRIGHSGVFNGKHLFLGGSTVLAALPETNGHVAYSGDLSGITAINLPRWVEKHLYEPGAEIAQMADWPAKIEAITARTLQRDISLLAGIPSWLLILAESVLQAAARESPGPVRQLQDIWPNLECLVHGGVPIDPYEHELRGVLGNRVNFHEVFPASEGFLAAQDAPRGQGLRLMTDVGIFYEFIRLDEYEEGNPRATMRRVKPLWETETDVDYVLVLTTPAGLTRYVIGDVVRFLSTDPYRMIYAGRTKLQLSAFGEHVIEREVTTALTAVCQRHGWLVVNFHVAPLFASREERRRRGRHEWWIELRPETRENPTGPAMAIELDRELQALNEDYEAKRQGGGLDEPIVRLLMPGSFEQWMRSEGKWGGQNKMPRCRSDRQIAEQFAAIARFCD